MRPIAHLVVAHPEFWSLVLAVTIALTWRPRPPVRRIDPTRDGPVPEPPPTTRPRPRDDIGDRSRPSRIADTMALAHWCEGVARSVRSGASLVAATAGTPPPPAVERELSRVVTSLSHGRTVDPAGFGSHPDLALVSGVLAACSEHGGAAAEPLDRVASVLRGRATEAAERQTQSAQVRWSARVMTVLPIAMLGLLLVSSTSVRHVVATPVGGVTIGLGAMLNLAGWYWLRRLVDGTSR